MRILLTGASGMVGKNFLEHHSCSEHIVLQPTHQELDLLNYDEVFYYIQKHKPDLIIHAAGIVGGIQANIKDPLKFYIHNLDMGRNLVLAAYELRVEKLLNLGSSCMYPKDAKNPLNEEMLLTGKLEPTNEGYALAKIAVAKLCEYISNIDDYINYKNIIPCNLYGRWDKYDLEKAHLVPAIINKIDIAIKTQSKSVIIWGDGTVRREFMYASDLADFIFFAINNYEKIPQYINVGTGRDYSIYDYYRMVSNVMGYKGKFEFDLNKPIGMKQKLVDVNKLNKLGWKSKKELEEGLKLSNCFYKNEYRRLDNGI